MIPAFAYLKLYAQSALLNKITPNLRAVCLNLNGNYGEIIFYYDENLDGSDQSHQVVQEIESSYLKDNKEISLRSKICRLDYPKKMPLHGSWVFYRYEDSSRYI